ncbi:hypothetical protein BV22DRAFT_1051428 [Leucogyrophana mollusca]|uniref:Uncharacterized protein n=1 Tax=Leucogyrophana mollusca TaxID=85980 RepID=A0ACB8AZR8_9AGAM|nr:hypothetical protein BV22DRAFT_1051428 [Leucogyrophana mollusca]
MATAIPYDFILHLWYLPAQPMFAVDPLDVTTFGTSKALSDFDEEHEHDDDDNLRSEPEMPDLPVSAKRSRKGPVHSGGGIRSTHAATDKEEESSAKSQALRILEPENWRQTPEEY